MSIGLLFTDWLTHSLTHWLTDLDRKMPYSGFWLSLLLVTDKCMSEWWLMIENYPFHHSDPFNHFYHLSTFITKINMIFFSKLITLITLSNLNTSRFYITPYHFDHNDYSSHCNHFVVVNIPIINPFSPRTLFHFTSLSYNPSFFLPLHFSILLS